MENLLKSKPTNKLTQLVTAWCEHNKTPCETTRDVLTTALNEQLRIQVPVDRFRGTILQGQEAVVRQDALIMLIGGFLMGNQKLMQASAASDLDQVAEELMRSICAAIRFVRLRLRRTILKDHARILPILAEGSWTGPLRESPEQEMRTIKLALRQTRQAQKLTLLDQQLAEAVLCEGEDYKKASRRLGISKSQGYRRIKRTIKVLRQHLEVAG